jgi:iron-regulated transporter 1
MMAVDGADAEAGSAGNSDEMENSSITQMSETTPDIEPNGMARSQAFNLYTSHFLSTWNVRTYEFAAVSAESGNSPRGTDHIRSSSQLLLIRIP